MATFFKLPRVLFFTLVMLSMSMSMSQNAEALKKKVGPGLYPALSLSYQYDDNIYRQDPDLGPTKDDFIFQATPSLTLFSLWRKHTFEASYFVDIIRFKDHTNEDFEDQYLDAKLELSLTRKFKMDFHTSYTGSHELRGASGSRIDQSLDRPDMWNAVRYQIGATYGRKTMRYQIRLVAQYLERRYTNNNQESRSRDRSRLTARFTYNKSPKTQFFLEAQQTNYDYYNDAALIDLTSEEQRLLVGVGWEATAKTRGELKVGYLRKNLSDQTLPDFEGLGVWADLVYEPKKRTTWKLSLSRSTRESGWELASYYDSWGIGLGLTHGFTRRLIFNSELYYSTDLYEMITDGERIDVYTSFNTGLSYSLTRWLDAGIRYKYSKRESDFAGINYIDNTIMISLSMDTMS